MATIKSFTSLEQSKKLAEILPLESADQTWERVAIAGANLDVPEELQYRHNGDMTFQYYSGIGIPCWSLAALLGVIKSVVDYTMQSLDCKKSFIVCELGDKPWHITAEYDNEIDACVEMILKLKENELI